MPRKPDRWFEERSDRIRWVEHLMDRRWHRAVRDENDRWETLCGRQLGDVARPGTPNREATKCEVCVDKYAIA